MSPEIIHIVISAGSLLALAVATYRIRPGKLAAMQSRTKVSRCMHGNAPKRTK